MISGRKLFDLYPLIFSALPTLATHILAPGLIVQEEMVNSSETPAALLWPNATNALFLIRADHWSNIFFALLLQCINVKSSDDGLDKVCTNDALQSCRYICTLQILQSCTYIYTLQILQSCTLISTHCWLLSLHQMWMLNQFNLVSPF